MPRFDNTERVGVARIEQIFLEEFNWIPRTLFQSDVGIDMLVELTEDGTPNGRLIGVQIKSGESYFAERDKGGNVIFRCSETHAAYWLNYSLPVMVVLYHPALKLTVWEGINSFTLHKTGKNYRIKVPLSNTPTVDNLPMLDRLAPQAPALNRLQRLIFDRQVIRKLQEDIEISLDWEYDPATELSTVRIIESVYPDVGEEAADTYAMAFPPRENELTRFSTAKLRHFNDLYHYYPWAEFRPDKTTDDRLPDDEEDSIAEFLLTSPRDWHLEFFPTASSPLPEGVLKRRYSVGLNRIGKIFTDFFNFLDGSKQLDIPFER